MKKNSKKIAAVTVMMVLTAGLISGCGGSKNENTQEAASSETGNGDITLTLWRATANDVRNAWWEEALAKFEEENPGIKIEYLGVAGDDASFNQKLDMAAAADEMPDIISTYCETNYITRGLIEPIDEYFNDWEYKDQIQQTYLDQMRSMDLKNKNPKLYAIPFGGNVQCMYARTDLLKAAGKEIPATWDEFFTSAETVNDKNSGIYGYIIRGGAGGANALEMLMYSYSGITDFFIDGKCTINDPKNVEFVEKFIGNYGKFTSEDDINKGWTEMAAQYQSGKAVLMLHNLGSAQANYEAFGKDENVIKAAPLPAGPSGRITLPSAKPAGNLITTSSEHKDAAWKLISWLAEPEQAGSYEQMMGNLPVNTEVLKEDWIQNISYMKMGADVYSDSNSQFCNFPYYLPNFTNIEANYGMPNLQKVMLGQLGVQEFLDGWAAELQKEYDSVMQ